MEADLERLGASPEAIAAFLPPEHLNDSDDEPDPDDVCDVWEQNWPTLELFLELETQWRLDGMGGLVGLDYAGVRAGAELMGITIKPDQFADLRAMERAVITDIAKHAAAANDKQEDARDE